MKEQLVVLAKEKGYNSFHTVNREVGDGWYIELCLLQRWLREVHNIHVNISKCRYHETNFKGHFYPIFNYEIVDSLDNDLKPKWIFETYEQALEFGLQGALKLIELCTQKQTS